MKKNSRRLALKWLGTALAGLFVGLPLRSAAHSPAQREAASAPRKQPSRKVRPAKGSVMRHG